MSATLQVFPKITSDELYGHIALNAQNESRDCLPFLEKTAKLAEQTAQAWEVTFAEINESELSERVNDYLYLRDARIKGTQVFHVLDSAITQLSTPPNLDTATLVALQRLGESQWGIEKKYTEIFVKDLSEIREAKTTLGDLIARITTCTEQLRQIASTYSPNQTINFMDTSYFDALVTKRITQRALEHGI